MCHTSSCWGLSVQSHDDFLRVNAVHTEHLLCACITLMVGLASFYALLESLRDSIRFSFALNNQYALPFELNCAIRGDCLGQLWTVVYPAVTQALCSQLLKRLSVLHRQTVGCSLCLRSYHCKPSCRLRAQIVLAAELSLWCTAVTCR
jgi:hypothetical protein